MKKLMNKNTIFVFLSFFASTELYNIQCIYMLPYCFVVSEFSEDKTCLPHHLHSIHNIWLSFCWLISNNHGIISQQSVKTKKKNLIFCFHFYQSIVHCIDDPFVVRHLIKPKKFWFFFFFWFKCTFAVGTGCQIPNEMSNGTCTIKEDCIAYMNLYTNSITTENIHFLREIQCENQIYLDETIVCCPNSSNTYRWVVNHSFSIFWFLNFYVLLFWFVIWWAQFFFFFSFDEPSSHKLMIQKIIFTITHCDVTQN